MSETAFDTSLEQVRKLTQDYEANRDYFLSPEYKESQARKDFIDKFLIALGWDVNHEIQKNPYQQEVKVEHPVKTGQSQRSADYAFSVAPNYHETRLFVEAKKPSSDLGSVENCFQTIRYAWNAKMPVSLLTNYEEFIVLDCRYKPDPDTATEKALQRYHYSNICDSEQFAKLFYLFSRDAVANGSLGTYGDSLPKRRGKAIQRGLFKGGWQPVDESFLEELDNYRDELARNFKNRNPALDAETLTEVTQRTLDRLVFLRFLEDKTIEPKSHVAEFGIKGNPWREFVACCRSLDSIYNGIVFKQHDILDSPSFNVDETQFADICEKLAPINSPYDFNFIPIHILGSIYERFLGKIIVVTGKRAHLELKPEVRKAGGVYYTPNYIVNHIVDNTIGKLIQGKTPSQIAKMRFADISCGSGSFLLGIYDLLIRYHLGWYNDHPSNADKAGCIKRDDGFWHLSLGQKREILLNNIFGVDIDYQAVEVAQLSLYLKLLEEETTISAHQYQLTLRGTVLPPLTKNIVSGNSLIERDVSDRKLFCAYDERKLNPMNFSDCFPNIMNNGGFDAIVGNPPYDVIEKARKEASWPHSALSEYGREKKEYDGALGGKLNLFRFFIIRSLGLIKPTGRLGLIVPLALLADVSCARTRKHLFLSTKNLEAFCFPQKDDPKRRIFKEAKLSTVVISGERSTSRSANASIFVSVYPGNSFSEPHKECKLLFKDIALLDPANLPVPLVDEANWALCRKIHSGKNVIRLGESKDFVITRGEINQTIYRKFITTDQTMARLLKGVEVGRYVVHEKLSQGYREWFDKKRYLKRYPQREVPGKQRIATQRITGVDERLRIVATIINPPVYFADSTNSITLGGKSPYKLEYLLALLNSKLFQWRFKLTSTNNNVGTNELDSMPFRQINPASVAESTIYNQLLNLVTQYLSSKAYVEVAKSDKDKSFYISKCASLDQRIDQLIYELYGLSEADVNLVEN